MPAPRHIVDALESVLSLYFSNCRHKERAAFILSDELVEVTCREKVKLRHQNLGRIGFHGLVTHAEVGLSVTAGLGKSVYDCHNTRNDMQHNNPAATVDAQHCADAIIDPVEVIEQLPPPPPPKQRKALGSPPTFWRLFGEGPHCMTRD
jgi:hypothetical protein